MRPLALLVIVLAAQACKGGDAVPHAEAVNADARPALAATQHDTAWTISPTGVGPVRFGAMDSALLAALSMPPRTNDGSVESCTYVRSVAVSRARGAGFMIVNDTVVRVDVDSSSAIATRWGDRVGDTEGAVLGRHAGSVITQPHKYTAGGRYLIVSEPGDTLHRVVFETDGKRVTAYRAGRRPEVDWTERCG